MEYDIVDAHKWLLRLKARTKLSNTALAEFIGYSDVGFAKAVKNNTLSIEQIELIAEKTQNLEEFNSNFSNNSINKKTTPYKLDDGDLDNLAILVNENWEDLKQHPLLVPKFESEVYKKAFDLVMEKMKS